MACLRRQTVIREHRIDTPLGCLELLAGPQGLRAVRFPGERPAARRGAGAVGDAGPGPVDPAACLLEAARQLSEYFAGERTVFELPLDPVGTPFQRAAWEVLRTIPFGRTISYGEQAARLGSPKAARAVGAANGRNPLPIVVPCHRVVGTGARLGGYAGAEDGASDRVKRALQCAEARAARLPCPPHRSPRA